jgi:catechol 2,3-dioxygenase-like lactoylglutathione lyase family enzyme
MDMIKPAKDALDLGVLVSDIDKSLEFYHQTLGLEFVGETPVWYGKIHRLRFGNSDLKLVAPNELPPRGAIGLENQLGFRYITLVVENLSEICERLTKKGIRFALDKTETRPGVHIAMVEDPDGNIVEFLQFTS